jgi:hypothetical protein
MKQSTVDRVKAIAIGKILKSKLAEHFTYEYWMMKNIRVLWQINSNIGFGIPYDTKFIPEESNSAMLFNNIFHESFCVHVYNLYKFGIDNKIFPADSKMEKLMKLVEEQVLTLTNSRTAVMIDKIGEEDRVYMEDFITHHYNLKFKAE